METWQTIGKVKRWIFPFFEHFVWTHVIFVYIMLRQWKSACNSWVLWENGFSFSSFFHHHYCRHQNRHFKHVFLVILMSKCTKHISSLSYWQFFFSIIFLDECHFLCNVVYKILDFLCFWVREMSKSGKIPQNETSNWSYYQWAIITYKC